MYQIIQSISNGSYDTEVYQMYWMIQKCIKCIGRNTCVLDDTEVYQTHQMIQKCIKCTRLYRSVPDDTGKYQMYHTTLITRALTASALHP